MRTTGATGRSSGERVDVAPVAPLLASGMTQPYYGAGSQVKQTAVLQETPHPAIALWRAAGSALFSAISNSEWCFPERIPRFPGALVVSKRARRATLVVLLPLFLLAPLGAAAAQSRPPARDSAREVRASYAVALEPSRPTLAQRAAKGAVGIIVVVALAAWVGRKRADSEPS